MYSGWEPCVKQNIPMFRFTQRSSEVNEPCRLRRGEGYGACDEAVQNIMTMKSRRKEFAMLFLQLKTGEYITIGDSVVVQLSDASSSQCKLMIEAPREIPVVRGELLERAGAQRPASAGLGRACPGTETKRRRWPPCGGCWARWTAAMTV